MSHLIRTELLKQRTVRTFKAGIAAAPVVAALVTVAVLSTAGHDGNEPLGPASLVQVIGAPVNVVTVISLLLGVLGMAGEFRHKTITTTFLSTPRRGQVVLAKLAAHSLTGALIGALSLVTSIGIAVPWLLSNDVAIQIDAGGVRVAAGVIVSSALYGALGVSIGALVRNQTTACAVVLIWLLAVEGIIGNFFSGSAFLQWLPVAAAHAIVRSGPPGEALPVTAAVVVFGGYVGALALAATGITVRRDVT